ncbi:spindle and kinetochore-associated protein 1 [Octopus bimaculoides]|uniref:SKA complex subunit 1 n=1 Tax=Octopus bimaculoides TaxID=37653 RepID=A0A0L8IB61_OCTBM|nr:spindle and kinetochore-associated protein 1 [Octopus bimaculoides]|eukprot:XP_014780089.1 PREDICTED: spindle and kinetochore-associated protein 1-like [Octopus bimaculoides]
MDNAKTLGELFIQFQERLDVINNMISLKECKEEDWYETSMSSIFNQLSTFEVTFAAMKSRLKDFREALENANVLKENLKETIEIAMHMKENLPEHFNNNKATIKITLDSASVSETNSACNLKENTKKKVNLSPAEVPQKITENKNLLEKEVKYIEFLTVPQFDSIPKYMKGRITYKLVNNVIEELTKCFEAKYSIMSLKRKAVPEKKKHIYEMYKAQETADTEGVYFIVENDMKEYSKLRNAPTTRSILVMLRHVGLIREIRGGGLVRYAATFY